MAVKRRCKNPECMGSNFEVETPEPSCKICGKDFPVTMADMLESAMGFTDGKKGRS